MKKILSRIFSVALIAATVASPSLAQTAKKATRASSSQAKATVTMKAQNKPERTKGAKGLNVLPRKQAAGPFREANMKKIAGRKATGIKKAASFEAANVPTLYGDVVYQEGWTEENAPCGIYNVTSSQTQVVVEGPNAGFGGVCVDGVYYAVDGFSFWGMVFVTIYAYDVESGEMIGSYDGTIENVTYGGMAYDATTGSVYGIGMTADGSAMQLAKYEFSESACTVTPIAALEGNWNSIACDSHGQLYGISYAGVSSGDSFEVTESHLNKIDKTTGAVTLIGETGALPQYLSSAAIDTKTDRMFWNVCAPDETSCLYEVDLTTGAATELFQYALSDEIMGMYVPVPAAEAGAPAECQNVSVNFPADNLAGTVTLTTPSTNFDGSAGSGELIVIVMANGEQVGYAETTYGKDVTVDVDLTLMGAGMYDFTIFASNEVGEGPKTKIKKVWVGADTPEATTATLTYANGNMEVSWLPVTASVNGGYFDAANLTYTVKRADGSVAAEGLTTTSFTEAVAEPAALTSYYYVVEAVCGELVSAPAQTNTVVLGSIVPPYTCDFESGIDGWTILDANADEKTWTEYQGAIRVSYNSAKAMDDWLITPPLKLEAGKAYNVSFQAKSNGTSFPERIEVKYGKVNTAEGMTETLVPATDLTTGEWEDFSQMLAPEEDGTYYIGFHGISDADMFYLWLDNFQIEAGVSALAPGLASNLTATADAAGALKCTVAFNAPDKTMNGQTLSSLTKVEILRGDEVIKTIDAPAVGAPLSYEDTAAPQGNVTYTVIGYNDEGAGLKASVTTFVGFDLPSPVESATIQRTDTEGQVIVSWTPVTTDIKGHALPAGEVTYKLVKAEGNALVTIAENLTGESYSYQAVEAGEQDFVQVGVQAVTSAGEGDIAATDMIPVGTPYHGISESFPGGNLNYIWGFSSIDGGTVNLLGDADLKGITSQDADDGFIAIQGQYIDAGADFFSGLISLDGIENPGLVFYTYNIVGENGDADINEITVSVKELGQEEWTPVMGPKTVDELCGGVPDEWGRVQVSLGAYANKTIQFQITGIVKKYAYMFFDNFSIGSILAHDVAALGITAPGKVKTGENYNVDVNVANVGAQAAEGVSVELYADEELVETKEVATIETGKSASVSFERTMSALAEEPVSYYAKVVYAADENAENNQTSSIEVVPVVSNLPVATDLQASNVEAGIKLTWNEPNLEGGVAEQVTDDFEDGDAFAAQYGDWTFADLDGSPVGGFQNMEIPGITSFETTGSFWIWDQSQLGNETFAAHSGSKYLFALFNADGTGNPPVQNNDWAISPELTGDAQTISFYARSYDTSGQYPENVAVYYSTGSKEASDFIKIEGAGSNAVPSEWTEFTADLPAGAKYFAIVCESYDSFMLMVDDVTYTPAGLTANLEIAGYNVYRDGVKINDALVADCEFVDTNVVVDTQYTYVVTVVYTDKGESKASNEVVIKRENVSVDGIGDGAVSIKAENGKIVVLNAEGLDVVVAAANGAVVYSGAGELKTEVAVANGVYVVTAGKTVRKVIVR